MSFHHHLALATLLALPSISRTQAPAQAVANPDSALLVSDDLRHFTRALQLLAASSNADTVAVLQQQYFDRASPGLRAYAARYSLTPQTLARALGQYPKYYRSLPALLDELPRQEARIRAAFTRLTGILPNAVFPPTFFLVGDRGAGGLTRPEGLLIAIELFGRSPKTDVSEFADSSGLLHPIDDLPHIVAHELLHYQQALAQGLQAYRSIFGERQTLLALAIREGSADFLAALVSGGTIYTKTHAYGRANEAKLWQAFRAEMGQREPGDWMFRRPANKEWPLDLGYFTGYRITEHFYRKATDKGRAIRDILAVTDYEGFLRASGYAERFAPE